MKFLIFFSLFFVACRSQRVVLQPVKQSVAVVDMQRVSCDVSTEFELAVLPIVAETLRSDGRAPLVVRVRAASGTASDVRVSSSIQALRCEQPVIAQFRTLTATLFGFDLKFSAKSFFQTGDKQP